MPPPGPVTVICTPVAAASRLGISSCLEKLCSTVGRWRVEERRPTILERPGHGSHRVGRLRQCYIAGVRAKERLADRSFSVPMGRYRWDRPGKPSLIPRRGLVRTGWTGAGSAGGALGGGAHIAGARAKERRADRCFLAPMRRYRWDRPGKPRLIPRRGLVRTGRSLALLLHVVHTLLTRGPRNSARIGVSRC